MNKLCKVLLIPTFMVLCFNKSSFLALKEKRAVVEQETQARVAILTNKSGYEANEELVLSMNVIDFLDLQGVSVSFNPDSTYFQVVTEGRLTDSYINQNSYTTAKTENGVFDYYSISSADAKEYDYHNNNSLFSIKLKTLVAIDNIENVFNISNDSTMLNFYENIFIIKLSDSKAKEINYSTVYGNYDDYSLFVPNKIDSEEPEIDFSSYIVNKDQLAETIICEIDENSYKPKTIGQQVVSYVFYDTLTGYHVSYDVPISVKDTKKPAITLKGEDNQEILIGSTYVDAGIDVIDNFDPKPNVTIENSIDTEKLGAYVVQYTVTDASGNKASISRNVKVVENGEVIESARHTHASKGNAFELTFYNNGERAITSFNLQFELKGALDLKVDSGCTVFVSGNKATVSGHFDSAVTKGKKLFSFVGTVSSNLNNFEIISPSLLSSDINIVRVTNNGIDGNYSLSYDPVVVGVYGDVNQDNTITLMDALLLNDHLNGKNSLENEILELCDVNLDGNIDETDVEQIRDYLVHKVEALGE